MKKKHTHATHRRISVLIADDHDMARRGIREIVESQPDLHVVAEASDGREAVEKARACEPSVVLTDIAMPEINGMEVTRQLQKELPGTQVLIITMHCSEELLKEAVQAGARGYLLKTNVDQELVQAIHALCRHRSHFQAAG
jgi:DNA-binding NarL/FixJ family response regulator